MKEIIGGKRYDTETARVIAERDCYENGNYCGTDYVGVTPRGVVFGWSTSNGQDLYRSSEITLEVSLDGLQIVDEVLAVKYKLIEEA